MSKITGIEISFPVGVELTNKDMQALDRLLTRVCDRYEEANPKRVMWPFGQGSKMLKNPLMLSDDEPIPFDDNVYAVEMAERERYDTEPDFKRAHYAHDPAEMFQDIADFHRKFELMYRGKPRELPADLAEFRVGFLAEELAEYITPGNEDHKMLAHMLKRYWRDGLGKVSLAKKFDALIDLVYVALGTAYLHGFPFDLGWARVHAANMAKVKSVGAGNNRGGTHDVVKPGGWTPPVLDDLVCPFGGRQTGGGLPGDQL